VSKKVVKESGASKWLGVLGSGRFWDRFNKAKDLKDEKSILLDHDYDGIKELDNDLPPWWKYGFYFTIVWAAAYLFYYHVSSNGISSKEEYEIEIAEAAKEVAAYKASMALNVDENTATLMTASSDLETGKKVWDRLNCATCHAADGGGGIGPNLTDEYWLYGGSVKDIFKTVKYGANNGMKAWENDMSAVEMQQVSSYILSLQGSSPADPKPAQGELYNKASETDGSENPSSDSLTSAPGQEMTIID
jgi:cytochrome c oxidase cbb3-type subunit 3